MDNSPRESEAETSNDSGWPLLYVNDFIDTVFNLDACTSGGSMATQSAPAGAAEGGQMPNALPVPQASKSVEGNVSAPPQSANTSIQSDSVPSPSWSLHRYDIETTGVPVALLTRRDVLNPMGGTRSVWIEYPVIEARSTQLKRSGVSQNNWSETTAGRTWKLIHTATQPPATLVSRYRFRRFELDADTPNHRNLMSISPCSLGDVYQIVGGSERLIASLKKTKTSPGTSGLDMAKLASIRRDGKDPAYEVHMADPAHADIAEGGPMGVFVEAAISDLERAICGQDLVAGLIGSFWQNNLSADTVPTFNKR